MRSFVDCRADGHFAGAVRQDKICFMTATTSGDRQRPSSETSLPSLHQLQILVAIGRSGSFTKAAKALHLTESAVSQQVKLLERTVHATLIERDPRPARATD